MEKREPVYGECAKHRFQSMIDCPECEMEKAIHETIIPKRVKAKISPYKPIMEINQSNANWIKHCVNKKRKKTSSLILNIEIRSERISVRLVDMEEGFPAIIGKGVSKHDINEAIRQVIDAYLVRNLSNVLHPNRERR